MVEFVCGNIFVRPNWLAKVGDQLPGHAHNFDHTTYVVTGSIRVRGVCPDGRVIEKTFAAGQFCLIKADVEHTITALADDTLFHCIYAHRTPQGDVVQEFTGWEPAYV